MPMGMMPKRRIGRARSYDVFNNSGAVAIRNVTASEVATTYLTSLTADQVIEGVATRSYVDSDGLRCTAHMAIIYTPPTVNTPLDDQAGNKDIELTPYTFAATSFEGPGLVYSAALASGAALPAWLTFDGSTRTLTARPQRQGHSLSG